MKYILLSLSILVLISCGENKIHQGEIEYKITYPYNDIHGVMEMMLPKKMSVIFKEDKMMITIKKGKIFSTKIISNETTRDLEMRLDFGSDVYNTHLDEKDLANLMESLPQYDVEGPALQDTIFGCNINKYQVNSGIDSIGNIENWFSEDFSTTNAAWFTSYKDLKGMPLKYLIDRYGIIMFVEAVGVKEREVKPEEFDPKETYEEISYKKYDRKLKELYDIMME